MKPKKTLLFAGGGYADIPLIKAARKLDYYVVSSGNRPEELGHLHSNEYRPADFSDKQAILTLANELEVDAICPSCNDFSAISCAYAAEQLGLPGHDSFETSLLLHHKDRYREFASEHDIPTPRAWTFANAEDASASVEEFTFPLIVKPVDLTGGKGVSKVMRPDELDVAIQKASAISRSSRIVIEEFIEGSRHGFSAFLREGKVVFHFSDDEYYYLNPYLVSGASTPTSAPPEAISELIQQSERIAGLLGLTTGIFHVQFIMRGQQPIIIEICRRPPGDLYIKLVEHATGIDYPSWIVRGFCGDDCRELEHRNVRGYYLRHCIMASRSGTLRSIHVHPDVEDRIIDHMMFWKPGDHVTDHLSAKFGIVFLKFDSQQKLIARSNSMQKLIHADIE